MTRNPSPTARLLVLAFSMAATSCGRSTQETADAANAPASGKVGQTVDFAGEAERLAKRASQERYTGHELGDYLEESMGIIERLLASMERDRAANDTIRLRLQELQAALLLESFEEELDLIDRNLEFDSKAPDMTVNVRDEGAVGDGTHDDGPAIRSAIAKAKGLGPGARVLVPSGTYLFADRDEHNTHLLIREIDDLKLEGEDGTFFVMKDKAAAIRVLRCRNVRIRNIAIDYDPLPFTQGTIRAIDEDSGSFDLDIWDGYPNPSTDTYRRAGLLGGVVVDPETKLIDLGVPDPRIRKVEPLGGNRYRLFAHPNTRTKALVSTFTVGKAFVLHPRNTPGGKCAVPIYDCEYVQLVDVRVHASWAHTYVGGGCTGLKFIRCTAEPRPGTNRLGCNNADGVHLGQQVKGPYLESCRMRLTHDDCFNSYVRWLTIARRDGAGAFTVARANTSAFPDGADVAVIDSNTARLAVLARVLSVEPTTWGGSNAVRIRLSHDIPDAITHEQLDGCPCEYGGFIAYKGTTPHFICNLSRIGPGIVIRNCDLGFNRSAGIKIQCPNAVVRNNTLSWHQLQCIRVESLLNWQEGFFPENVLVQGNTFRNKKRYLKNALTVPGGHGPPERVPFRNVIFEDNTEIGDLSGVSLRDIDAEHRENVTPWRREAGPQTSQ